jgi:formylglycine-generating enzyme required for sulfatase activity/tetratricopeptide (TPR) repeat protein
MAEFTNTATEWFAIANQKYGTGNFQGAIDDCTRAIKAMPEFAEPYMIRGEAKWRLKNYPAAIADYNKAIKVKPELLLLFSKNGAASMAARDFAGAIVHFTKAIYLQPNDAEAYKGRGDAKVLMKDYQGAIADYNRVVDLQPDRPEAYFSRGNAKVVVKNFKGAIADYDQVIEMTPDHAGARRARENVRKFINNPKTAGEKRIAAPAPGAQLFTPAGEKTTGTLLVIVSPPDAALMISGNDYTNQALIELPPGEYQIEIRQAGYYGQQDVIDVRSGHLVNKQYSLAPKTGTLDFTVLPPVAHVKLMRGTSMAYSWMGSSIQEQLLIGQYQLVCNASGHATVKKDIVIVENGITPEAIVMEQGAADETMIAGQFVCVRSGTFQMGGCGQFDEKPVHTVTLSDFFIGKYPITQHQWHEVMGNNPSLVKGKNLPVTHVSWNDIQHFIKRLNDLEGLILYRLPTEAEWEFAARGGINSRSLEYSGSAAADTVAWCAENSEGMLHPVGQKERNELGIHDMSGNVSEWCRDWYDKDYYQKSPRTNPAGPSSGTDRVVRGGSWTHHEQYCRVSNRNLSYPAFRSGDLGFRLARTQ